MAAPNSAGTNPVIFTAVEQTFSGGIRVGRVEWDYPGTTAAGACAFREGGTATGNTTRVIVLRAEGDSEPHTVSRDYGIWLRDLVLSTLSLGTVRIFMPPY